MKAKKLIEVAMPIKEISAESVRDKSIRHGHISTLHLWWARRPLPTCRAVVFASLVPDPLDENCPKAFQDAVQDLLCTGFANTIYRPYKDIPYTAAADAMDDNLRNRLLMFIGKFSEKCQSNMIAGKATSPREQIQDGCLIKWESKNNPQVLEIARKIIWVAHNAEKYPNQDYEQLATAFESAIKAIRNAEYELYETPNRHLDSPDVKEKEARLRSAIAFFQDNMPSVFDPFAGGGAIPLEAARLGCRSFGNDINPVAHIIEKGSVEFPQKYGKPITFSNEEFDKIYGEEGRSLLAKKEIPQYDNDYVILPNRLSFDVEYYARKLIKATEEEVGHLYPVDENGNKPIAYYWARTAKCSNPSCSAEIPLLRQFYLADTTRKKVYLNPVINGQNISFEIKTGRCSVPGWMNRANLTCPCCGAITTADMLKTQFKAKTTHERLLAVIEESDSGKSYRLPSPEELEIVKRVPEPTDTPQEMLEVGNTRNFNTPGWGISSYGELFTKRQLVFLNCLTQQLKALNLPYSSAYSIALNTYLGIFVDRIAIANTSFGTYHIGGEKLEKPMGRQAIPMVFDYPESNPFCSKSGSAINQLEWIIRYLESESSSPFWCEPNHASSGEKNQFAPKSLSTVVTDPPYYDAIAYADLSDFFYVWLKRTLSDIYNLDLATPKTPKSEECTALKHHHGDSDENAKKHFEDKLLQIFQAIEEQTSDVVSIMFAHQSTEAWTTLCNSILGANMNIEGSWAMDTEMQGALKTGMQYLESSVTVACRPSERSGYANYKKVKDAIHEKVYTEVRNLYALGFRGADLLTACFGKAVSVFGNYESVEKADGSPVTVGELLELARTSAYTALLRDFTGDEYTKFYIGWLQLNGIGDTDFDDATKFTRVGMSVNIGDIFAAELLIRDEGTRTQHLASYKERKINEPRFDGESRPLIDKVHRAMWLYGCGDEMNLLPFISKYGQDLNNEFWHVFVVLKELLPVGTDDYIQASGLLQNAESLIRRSKELPKTTDGPSLWDTID